MNFTCNGIITGYTAALKQMDGEKDPVIQVWRKNTYQPAGSNVYHNTSAGIAIDKALCVDGLTTVSSEVFHCSLNLSMIMEVHVQPGDILGLELPNRNNDDIKLAFAGVSSGPTNYVYTGQVLSSSLGVVVNNMTDWNLPQITLEIGSGK